MIFCWFFETILIICCFIDFKWFYVDFWSVSGASKPWKWWFRISETLFFIKSLFRKSDPKRWWTWRQNAPKTVSETLERSTKKRVENVDRFFNDFDWFWPPKKRSKQAPKRDRWQRRMWWCRVSRSQCEAPGCPIGGNRLRRRKWHSSNCLIPQAGGGRATGQRPEAGTPGGGVRWCRVSRS